MSEVYCGRCEYYQPKTRLVNKGEVNVSGGPVWYRERLSHCKHGHDTKKENHHCVYYEPNADTIRRDREFKLKMLEMENART